MKRSCAAFRRSSRTCRPGERFGRPHHRLRWSRRCWRRRADQASHRTVGLRAFRRRSSRAVRPPEDADPHAALRRAAACGRGGRDLRPQLARQAGRRARHGILPGSRRATAPAEESPPRSASDRSRRHAAEMLPDGERGQAGPPLRQAHRRSRATVEAVANEPRILPAPAGLHQRLRDVTSTPDFHAIVDERRLRNPRWRRLRHPSSFSPRRRRTSTGR